MADVTMTVPSGVTSTQIGGVSYATSASGTISVPAEYATELLDAGYLPGLPIGMITGVDSSAVAKIGESGGSPTWNSGAWPGGTSSGIGEFDDTWVPTFNVPIDPYNGGDYNPAHMMFYDGAEGGGDTCSIIGRRQKIGNITFGIITFTITSTNSSLTIPNNGVYITNLEETPLAGSIRFQRATNPDVTNNTMGGVNYADGHFYLPSGQGIGSFDIVFWYISA